jgi:molecular chaperone HtpG
MPMENVGAGILNIVTESLYEKPIVVFREYVQNSVDSILKTNTVKHDELYCRIENAEDNLFFLDNGNGIEQDKFHDTMKQIAYSKKTRTVNIGYKGIGRLSGIPYCKKISFLNVVSYAQQKYQIFVIDCEKYNQIKKSSTYAAMGITDLMEAIGNFQDVGRFELNSLLAGMLSQNKNLFLKQDKGFLVLLEGISPVLKQVVEDKELLTELGWLLPVKFKSSLLHIGSNESALFQELSFSDDEKIAPAAGFNISYNGTPVERPIEPSMLRDYTCKCDLKYAVGFHSFRRDRIAVESGNIFSGIKIYIDNMLLCDETELIPILQKYGLIDHTANELLQTVKGIGAMIYITDKVNITANARRTFIEITDSDSIDFLDILAEFVVRIYKARYALSKYSSGKKNYETSGEKLTELKNSANEALVALAREEIVTENEEPEIRDEFENLSSNEKKQIIKRKITKEINEKIKMYLLQVTTFDYDNAFENFKIWIKSN